MKEVEERRGKMYVAKEVVCHPQCSIDPELMKVFTQHASPGRRRQKQGKGQ